MGGCGWVFMCGCVCVGGSVSVIWCVCVFCLCEWVVVFECLCVCSS